ncbi:hypothetical protein HYX05_01275 [Candidatus Woesearchaeota archaeon]|nr:hypothetical protein [Candidatus Woesearchaeota archaeon]
MAYEQPVGIQSSVSVEDALPVIRGKVSAILRGEVLTGNSYKPHDLSNTRIYTFQARNGRYAVNIIVRDYRAESEELSSKGIEFFLMHDREATPNAAIDKRIEDAIKEAFGARRFLKELAHMDVRDVYSYLLRRARHNYRKTTPVSLAPLPP